MDWSGKRFGALTFVEHMGSRRGKLAWLKLRCDCGNVVVLDSRAITRQTECCRGCPVRWTREHPQEAVSGRPIAIEDVIDMLELNRIG